MSMRASIRANIPRSLKNKLKDSRLNYLRLFLFELRMKILPPRYFGQTAEDAILKVYLPESKGFYLDVGAGRPIVGSNTFGLYLRGWIGICVDPISTNVSLIKSFRRKDEVLNILVGPKDTTIDFWEFEPYGYSTADEAVAAKVKKYAGIRLINFSKKIVRPLSAIAPNKSPNEAVLLSVDVEGLDLEVLKSNDWSVFHPRVICIEEWRETMDEHFNSEVSVFLTQHNYVKVAFTGLSSIFVEKNYLSSMPKL